MTFLEKDYFKRLKMEKCDRREKTTSLNERIGNHTRKILY